MTTAAVLCSACSVYFDSDNDRREHMRGEWHVFNIRQRMASLPSVSFKEYETRHTTCADIPSYDYSDDEVQSNPQLPHDPLQKDGTANDDEIILPPPEQCIFCPYTSNTLAQNIAHMKTTHGFQIPDVDNLQTDLETFISYLALVVSRYFSCLYCGHTKHSAQAIQAHMSAKGHCMLDLSPGSEFLEFWDTSIQTVLHDTQLAEEDSSMRPQIVSETEMRLPSGAIASNRHSRPRAQGVKKTSSTDDMSLIPVEQRQGTDPDQDQFPAAPQSRAIARRDQMGIVGLSDQQRRALITVDRNFQSRESRRRGARLWASAKLSNRQRNFRAVGSKNFRTELPVYQCG